jgi:Fe-S-cluster-containing hydrogenase component 2
MRLEGDFRTIQSIDQERCAGCGTCMEICPVDTFRIDEETQKAII